MKVKVIPNSDAYREGHDRIWGKEEEHTMPESPIEALIKAIIPDVRFVTVKGEK